MMKQFILKTILFVTLFAAIVVIVGRFDNRDRCITDNNNILKLNATSNFDSLDILFIGNSYCYSGINSLILDSLGLKTFNLGIANAGPEFYSMVLNDYLAGAKVKPRNVFILVSPMIFTSKADDAINYPIYRYLKTTMSHEDYLFLVNRSAAKDYPRMLIRSFTKAASNTISLLRTKANKCDPKSNVMVTTKGFVGSMDTFSVETEVKTKHLYAKLQTDSFDNMKSRQLLELAASVKQRGVNVVFFDLPANKLNKLLSPAFIEKYNEFLKVLNSKYRFLKTSDTNLKQSYYRDIDHLNTAGSVVMTRRLTSLMAAEGVLRKN